MNEDLRTEEEVFIESIPLDFLKEELAKLPKEYRGAKYFWAEEFSSDELAVHDVTPKGFITYIKSEKIFIPFDKVQ